MIYMQIQVGKMLSMGMIDQETVYWQELPKNVGDEHTANVKIILSGCSFDDAIVMGKLLLLIFGVNGGRRILQPLFVLSLLISWILYHSFFLLPLDPCYAGVINQ